MAVKRRDGLLGSRLASVATSRAPGPLTRLVLLSHSWRAPNSQRARGCQSTSSQPPDRKSTRLNSSHLVISYAVFCLKKKKKKHYTCPHPTQPTPPHLHTHP